MFSALHELVLRGDLAGLQTILESNASSGESGINAYDAAGLTPLMLAVRQPKADLAIIDLLLQRGADIHQQSGHRDYQVDEIVIGLALGSGDPKVVERLLQAGANLHYDHRPKGYTALLNAVHSRDIMGDDRLLDLLKLLISHRVDLNSISSYAESGLRVLSCIGRFDAVRLLLEAGADESQLGWTPLLKAIALGTLDDVKALLTAGASLTDRDWWERTPWLLALQTGALTKAQFLYKAGADTSARGRCGKPSLFYAIESRKLPLLRWLISIGADINQTEDSGETPLLLAVEQDNLEAIDVLIASGANLECERFGATAVHEIQSRAAGMKLLQAGANPQQLSYEGQRLLLGLSAEPGTLTVSLEEFDRDKNRRFGTTNPERMSLPFWIDMIHAGVDAYLASTHFGFEHDFSSTQPIWCADRFGQSITFLPDGRIIQIAGEHEDYYDPDFCIYNDVFVHHPSGAIEIFGYPEADFPPTDFHTATLLDDGSIWIIGSLGYGGARQRETTPVYRLDTTTMKIERIEVTGLCPGWIHRHTARLLPGQKIEISSGLISKLIEGKEHLVPNELTCVLDTFGRSWPT
jgi:ankyrin repeat protein